jgi:phosphoribosylanthranilate isomerase
MVRVKVCCIGGAEEARLAVRLGASALGLVSEMPSGPGVIAERSIAELARVIPPGVASFLLTSRTDPAEIALQQRRCRTNTVQICDRLAEGAHQRLRDELPGVALVQVVHVIGPESLDEAVRVAPHVDAVLLDSGRPDLAVKELGGTGRVHDWEVSRQIREAVSVPVFLAGGLRADNVRSAIERVRPYGVDVCSGVRTDHALDAAKLAAFLEQVAAAALPD